MKKLKHLLVAVFIIVLSVNTFSQGVGINTDESDADPSAILDVKSTTQGMLVPRMTSIQANAISNPADGLVVFATDINEFLFYNGIGWKNITRDFTYFISDYDFDTGITTGDEGQPDVDKISIFCGNTSLVRFFIDSMRIAPNMNSVFVGKDAGGLFSDRENVALGDSACFWNGTGATQNYESKWNTAVGSKALFTNTSGYMNTAMGNEALFSNIDGSGNTANGFQSLYNNTTGTGNVAGGIYSLLHNTTGHSNVAVGTQALFNNTTRSNLVAIGDSALYNNGNGASGAYEAKYNTAVGSKALSANTIGYSNTATGYKTLNSNDIGTENTAFGSFALYANTSGSSNVAIGNAALEFNDYQSDNVAVGDSALSQNGYGGYYSNEGIDNTAIGSKSMKFNISGSYNTACGTHSLFSNSTGSYNTATGDGALSYNYDGNYNTAIGYNAFVSGGYDNSTAVGHSAPITADNMVRLGDNNVNWIGGASVWHNTSDGRFKRNVKENVAGVDFILKLHPVTYTWDIKALDTFMGIPDSVSDNFSSKRTENEKIVHTGFIAQEVEQAANELGYSFDGVHHPANEKDPYSLAYAQFVVPLVKAVQEQQAMIEELKAEIEFLKTQVKK